MKSRKDYDLASIDANRYRELKYFCYQYKGWKQKIEELTDDLGPPGMNYDGMPHSSSTASSVEKKAVKLLILEKKVECVEKAARMASDDLHSYILLYCTTKEVSFDDLEAHYKIPCSRATFYRCRALFYRHLSKLLEAEE